MKILKRIWNYFFSRKNSDPPIEEIRLNDPYKKRSIEFFEPITMREKFETSESFKDFLQKLDKK